MAMVMTFKNISVQNGWLREPFMGGGGYYDVATTVTSYYFWKFDAHILKD